MRVKELFAFIKERHAIYERRFAGKPKPWTKDPILQSYRFCNVYRENDKVTIWIRKNWREPFDSDPSLWFLMAVARLVNWPESLDDIRTAVFTGGPHSEVTWIPKNFVHFMDIRKKRGEKVFTGAYMVRSDKMDKSVYLATRVLTPLWNERHRVAGPPWKHLAGLHQWLEKRNGLGSFMAAQVVADVKFQTCWAGAPDWWTFAAPGPGSERGLNRIIGADPKAPWQDVESWKTTLKVLQSKIDPLVAKAGMPRISAQDLQNCLCEFDKYERVRLGEGRPRSKYPGV